MLVLPVVESLLWMAFFASLGYGVVQLFAAVRAPAQSDRKAFARRGAVFATKIATLIAGVFILLAPDWPVLQERHLASRLVLAGMTFGPLSLGAVTSCVDLMRFRR